MEIELSPLQKKRLYIEIMDTYETKKEIAQNFDPEHFNMKMDLENVRTIIIQLLQNRDSIFSRQILSHIMKDVIKHHDTDINTELFCAAVTGGETQLALKLAQRLPRAPFLGKYFQWLFNLPYDQLLNAQYHSKRKVLYLQEKLYCKMKP